MNTDEQQIIVSGLQIKVVRKAIKNLHLGVYPPNGRVRIAVPLLVSDDAVRMAIIRKLGWIKRQQAKFETQARQSQREMANSESHYYLGQRYRLNVIENRGKGKIVLRSSSCLDLHVPPGSKPAKRRQVLREWYREQLRALIPPYIEKWAPTLGVQVDEWGIKRMKTRWGSCNRSAKRIWLNLELAKKPVQCIEYVVVHELVHLVERNHNENFKRLMDSLLPQWRLQRAELNRAPLGHEDWNY